LILGKGNEELQTLPDLAIHTVLKAWLSEDGGHIVLQHVKASSLFPLSPSPRFSLFFPAHIFSVFSNEIALVPVSGTKVYYFV
jgi:hypothetical protein